MAHALLAMGGGLGGFEVEVADERQVDLLEAAVVGLGRVSLLHALLREAEARDLLRCRRRRYDSGIGSSSALHLTHLSPARDERE